MWRSTDLRSHLQEISNIVKNRLRRLILAHTGVAVGPLGWGIATAFGGMTLVWLASVARKNASYVDRAWGVVAAAVGWSYLLAADSVSTRALVAVGLVTVWGVRLTGHLTATGWGRGEEWRHASLRVRYPDTFALRSLFAFFWAQAFGAVGVSLPLLAVALDEQARSLHFLDVVGGVMWVSGVTIESVADAQLRRFRREGSGVCASGLWRYSRHPNYFGDAVMWWGLGMIGVAAGHAWSLLGPVAMTIVLVFGSGVRAMDRHMRTTRGAAYAEYAARTSAFVPLPPRRRPPSANVSTGLTRAEV